MVLTGFIAGLASDARTELKRLARVRWYNRNMALLQEGAPSREVLILDVGRVKIVRSSVEGPQLGLAVRGPGELLGEIGAMEGTGHTASVIAMEQVRVKSITAANFRHFLQKYPDTYRHLAALQTSRLREAESRRLEYRVSTVTTRLAAVLLRLCDEHGVKTEEGEWRVPRLTRSEMADYVAASEKAIDNALRELRLGGVDIERRSGSLHLTGWDALREAARA